MEEYIRAYSHCRIREFLLFCLLVISVAKKDDKGKILYISCFQAVFFWKLVYFFYILIIAVCIAR